MERFAGFPDGAIQATPIPQQFFAQLLPAIDSLAELKVTLQVLARTGASPRAPAYLSLEQLLRDPALRAGLAREPGGAAAALKDGLQRAVDRGTLLRASIRYADGAQVVVAPNTARGRRALAALHASAAALTAPVDPPEPPTGTPAPDRPAIFALYESNVGLIQPIIADELRAAAELYPAAWIEDAFRQAVAYNRRNWRYVKRILERWATEGKDSDATPRERAAGTARAAAKRRWLQTYDPREGLPDL